jgi:hypothetical protein
VFVEYGSGDSEIHCKKKSIGASRHVGGGFLGRYDLCEDEFSGTKMYGIAVLRGGAVNNNFKGKEVKETASKLKYDIDVMYGGAEAGVGYKYKANEKIAMDLSLRYMFGYQDGKDGVSVDTYGNKVDFENVIPNRIRAGVRGKYMGLGNVKPYVGIGCEQELSGKVKAAIQNGADMIGVPVPSFGGWTGIGEVGASGKVWKFEVDIIAQGYTGVRAGFGGMLKIKYAFGKQTASQKTREKSMRHPKDEKKEATEPETEEKSLD